MRPSEPPCGSPPNGQSGALPQGADAGAGGEYAEYARLMSLLTAHYLECKAEYDPISVFVSSKIDPIPYQIYDFARMRKEEDEKGCIRALVAYETGLGKTILVGMLIKELLGRGAYASTGAKHAGAGTQAHMHADASAGAVDTHAPKHPFPGFKPSIKRVLIVVPPSVLPQFRAEMKDKFGLEFETFDPSAPRYSDMMIASMDTLKRYRWMDWLSNQVWDLVVVDEYHRASPNNLRGKLATLLSGKTKHFVALTATPHDGSSEKYEFRRLAIAQDPLIIRRTKREATDIADRPLFDHVVEEAKAEPPVTKEESEFYESAERYVRNKYRAKGGGLLAALVGRAISSSIRAGLKMLKRRRSRIILGDLAGLEDDEAEEMEERVREGGELSEEEIDRILGASASKEELEAELDEINPLIERGEELIRRMPVDSKGKYLYDLVEKLAEGDANESNGDTANDNTANNNDAKGTGKARKAIIFTSFRETVEYLKGLLGEFEPLEITGSTDMEERKRIVEKFTKDPRHKVLIGTDAMGESLNLQAASVEVNYEVPWSPVAYIQRVGRIWRLKQENKHLMIVNFLPPFPIERRVMEVVLEKIRTINEEFGDIGLSVFGRELGPLDEVLKAAYVKAEEGTEAVESAFRSALETGKRVVEELNANMALPRIVNAEELHRMHALDLADVVTEEDLKRFLGYLRDAGLAVGKYPDFFVCSFGDYVRVASLSLESRGMRAAIEAGKRALDARNGGAKIKFNYFKGMKGEPCIAEVKVKGATVFRELVVLTPDGVLNYRGMLSLAPSFTGREFAPAIIPLEEYKEALKSRWLGITHAEWERARSRLIREYYEEKEEYRRDWISNKMGELSLYEPTDSTVSVELKPLKAGAGVVLAERAAPGEAGAEGAGAGEADAGEAQKTGAIMGAGAEVEGAVEGAAKGAVMGADACTIKPAPEDARGLIEFVQSSPEWEWRARWEVEKAAMDAAVSYYKDKGYEVEDVSRQNRGYDLLCTSKGGDLMVEVKGLRSWSTPELTQNEKSMAEFYRDSYVLFVVKLENGRKAIYEVPNPHRNLELKVVWKPFYEAHGFEKFKVVSSPF